MGVINHDHGIVLIRQITNSFEVSDDSIHGKDSVGSNQFLTFTISIRLLELLFESVHVIVRITVSASFTKTHTIDDRCMVQLIRNNGIVRPEKHFKQAAIGIEARRIKNGIFGA